MATINNSDILKRIIEEAKIQTSVDEVPTQLASKVVPVLISNPQQISKIVREQTAVNTTATIYTTPADKDFYLSSLSLTNDRGADGMTYVSIVIDGETHILLRCPSQAGSSGIINSSYIAPVKIDRESVITITSSVALLDGYATITGYLLN